MYGSASSFRVYTSLALVHWLSSAAYCWIIVLRVSMSAALLTTFIYTYLFTLNHVCICVSVGMVHISACACGSQKRAPDTLDALNLELQVVVRSQVWVLGTKLRSFARAASALHCWVISRSRPCSPPYQHGEIIPHGLFTFCQAVSLPQEEHRSPAVLSFFFFFNRSFVYTRKTETVASSGEETRSIQQPHSLPG